MKWTPAWRSVFDVSVGVVMLAAGVVVIWSTLSSQTTATTPVANPPATAVPVPTEPVSFQQNWTLGEPSARIAVVVFSDFECPYCQKFAVTTFPLLKADYVDKGKIRVVFANLPLPIHKSALSAAIAAECAGKQGRFWPMHDSLFARAGKLSETDIGEAAKVAALGLTDFQRCVTEASTADIDRDSALARSLGISSTPMFLVGLMENGGMLRTTTVIRGAQPYAAFKAAIDEIDVRR